MINSLCMPPFCYVLTINHYPLTIILPLSLHFGQSSFFCKFAQTIDKDMAMTSIPALHDTKYDPARRHYTIRSMTRRGAAREQSWLSRWQCCFSCWLPAAPGTIRSHSWWRTACVQPIRSGHWNGWIHYVPGWNRNGKACGCIMTCCASRRRTKPICPIRRTV